MSKQYYNKTHCPTFHDSTPLLEMMGNVLVGDSAVTYLHKLMKVSGEYERRPN